MPFKQQTFALGLTALLALLVACSNSSEPAATPTSSPEPEPSATSTSSPAVRPATPPSPVPTLDPRIPEPPALEGPGQLMLTALQEVIFSSQTAAIGEIRESGDPTYIPALVELLRFNPFYMQDVTDSLLYALDTLSAPIDGITFSTRFTWSAWVKWLAENSIDAPQGFAAWKGYLYTLVDPAMGAFLYEGVPTRIDIGEVVWGGVAKDGIPDLRDPPVVSPEAATYLNPDDRVFGISINGEHRA